MKITLDKGAHMPERAHDTDAGIDLRTPKKVTVPAHGSTVIDTGVHVELPHGCAGLLVSKSGLNVNHSILTDGLIDEGYSGSVKVKIYNHGSNDWTFEAGDKVTQLVVVPVRYPDVQVVQSIDGGERGNDGFGSTGR
jgi:dUTP pyrophosphatase|nr:MAG TPA: dUTPase [Caudoviricetes sp.]